MKLLVNAQLSHPPLKELLVKRLRLVIKSIKTIEPETELLYYYGEKDPNIIKHNPWLKD